MKRATKWGIAGIGKLGTAILSQFDQHQLATVIYHPDTKKAEMTGESFSYAHALQKNDLASLDYLILALPANQIVPFINDHKSKGIHLQKPVLINMATSLPTEKLRQEFPDLTWLGMKVISHSESLKKYGEAVFVTEEHVLENNDCQEVVQRFSKLGQLMPDEESVVEKVNKSATYHAIKAAREIERKMDEEGFSHIYKKQVLCSVLPEVIRAYSKGQIGHFAQEIVKDLDEEDKC